MAVRHAAAFLSILLVATACQEEKPTVSLEQAKKITADFAQTSFTPPPRTIDDIAAVLERDRPDPGRIVTLEVQADAPVTAGDRAEQAFALLQRSKSAFELGRIRQARDDAAAALTMARAANADPHDILMHLRLIATLTGSLDELMRISEQIIDNSSNENRGRLFGVSTMLAYNLATTGDEAGAQRVINGVRALLSEAADWQRGQWRASNGDFAEGMTLVGEGGIDLSLGRNASAETSTRSGIALIERWVPTQPSERQDYLNGIVNIFRGGPLVDILVRQGRLAEAEAMSRLALSTSLRLNGRDHATTAFLLTSFARVIMEQGRLEEGERLARATVGIYEKIGASVDSWRALEAQALLGDALAARGRWQEALAVFDRMAAAFAGNAEGRRRFVETRPGRALTLVMAGKAAQANAALETLAAEREGTLGRNHYQTAELKGIQALAQAAIGKRQEALALYRAAVPVLLQRSRKVEQGVGGDSSAVRAQRLQLILNGYIAALSEQPGEDAWAEAFRIADAARAGAVQGALSAAGARAAARDPALADLARREQDAQSQISALYGALTVQYDLPSAARKADVITRLRAQIDSLRAARAALGEEIERRFPAYADLTNPKPATVAQARASLRNGEALIATYVGMKASYVWAVRKTGPLAFAAVPVGRDRIAAAVRDLRRALDPQVTRLGDIPAFDVAGAHRLYRAILQPVEAGWKDAKSLLVVAHGALGQLPFSVLVTRPQRLGPETAPLFSNYRDVAFLARDHAVTVLPSVPALSGLRALPPAPAARRNFAGFGDPQFNPAQAARSQVAALAAEDALASRGLLAVRGLPLRLRAAPENDHAGSADLARLPRLPDTADEVSSIAVALNADLARDVFTGRRASEGQVKSMLLSGYRVVAFATHGLVPGDLDGLTQPALALSLPAVTGGTEDGLLTMGEILGLRLDADWVVLSACNTASGDGAGAEAISGLGRAFFYAGTRALLVSYWPVETTSARMLTTDIFRRQSLRQELPRAEALRQSMLALIDGPGNRDAAGNTVFSYAHPIFWAPFSLIGDGGGSVPGG